MDDSHFLVLCRGLAETPRGIYTFPMISETIRGLEKLSAADKLSLVTELWEELEGMNEALSVSDQHKMMLDERYARHGEHPEPGKSWPEVKDRLLNEIGD